jgi:hypothetical protein
MGWALKIETFSGPEMAMSEASAISMHSFHFILYSVLYVLSFMSMDFAAAV